MRLLTREAAERIDKALMESIGIPRDVLIEHAAMSVAKWCACYLEKREAVNLPMTVQVFAGKGMNGSDAVACAGILFARGCKVHLWDVFPDSRNGNDWRKTAAIHLGLPVQDAKKYQPDEKELIVDGIFGTAFTADRELSPSLKELFVKINKAHDMGNHVVAIDLPSGVETDTGAASPYTIAADETVTFICPKIGIITYPGRKYAGEIRVENIGIPFQWIEQFTESNPIETDFLESNLLETDSLGSNPSKTDSLGSNPTTKTDFSESNPPETDSSKFIFSKSNPVELHNGLHDKLDDEAFSKRLHELHNERQPLPILLDLGTAAKWLAKRPEDGHKGTFGSVGIIGGAPGMAGSVCLSAMAAMRCGVGLTYMRVPKSIVADCLAVIPESLVSTEYKSAFEATDAVLIGPGLDQTKQTVQMLWRAIVSLPHLVLDAGALNIMSSFKEETACCLKERQEKKLPWMILTPHPGEFKRLAPDLALLDRVQAAGAAAKRFGSIVVLKGAGTVIADPEGTLYINTSGNSAMAKGGSGDVLSGMIASFLAQGQTPMAASAFAVFFHGLCGDLAAREWGGHAAIPGDFIKKIPEAFRVFGETG